MEQIINVNRLFRLAIYHRSNMPILCEMIEQLWVRMGPGLHYLYEAINPAEYGTYRKLSSVTRCVKSKRQRGMQTLSC